MKKIQNKIKEYASNIENIRNSLDNVYDNYLTNSMLFEIEDLDKIKNIFESKNFFKQSLNEHFEKEELLRKNWNEKCYIYNDYDIHDINYELKAVGLPENRYYHSASNGFYLDTFIEILEFEIDGKKSEFTYEDYQLKFNILLYNLEENKIHIKYKQSPLYDKLTEGEKKLRKIYKSDFYGISSNIKGQKAKFTLKNNSDYEIINFKDEIFIKTEQKEYTWAGEVPIEGKRTIVYMSKIQAEFNIEISYRIESSDNKPLKRTKLKIPIPFKGGNNELLDFMYKSEQTEEIILNKDKKEYEIDFKNISKNYGEFFLKNKLTNSCKGGWFCDLTDKEIEENTPEDIKNNKEELKKLAKKIIEDYDKIYQNKNIKVKDLVKIGKYIKENIKYNISYKGKTDMTVNEILAQKVGVCHHFTKLFNALAYSLGYKCIYVSGYVIKENDFFTENNTHSWSLIKIDEDWLPFDATWGIFTGKLPVCHIFQNYFPKGIRATGIDPIVIKNTKVQGNFFR